MKLNLSILGAALALSMSVHALNLRNQDAALVQSVAQAPKICCKAMTAQCLSCAAGKTLEEYCSKHPSIMGCPTLSTCSSHHIGERRCENPSVHGGDCTEYTEQVGDIFYSCQNDPDSKSTPIKGQWHCKRGKPCKGKVESKACCKALIATCLACQAGLPVVDYCKTVTGVNGCPKYDDIAKRCVEEGTDKDVKMRDCLVFDKSDDTCTDLTDGNKDIDKSHCIRWDDSVERCRSRINGQFVPSSSCVGVKC